MLIDGSPEWSLILGDAIQNYRSVLDYLAWTAVDLGTEPKPLAKPWEIQFPIIDSRHFATADKSWRKEVAKRLPGVDATFIDIAKGHQPYDWTSSRGDERHPLALLNFLSNRDKHRELQLMREYILSFKTGQVLQRNCTVSRLEPIPNIPHFHPGTDVLYAYIVPDRIGQPDVRVGAEAEITPAFALDIFDDPPLAPEHALENIAGTVGSILTEFEAAVANPYTGI